MISQLSLIPTLYSFLRHSNVTRDEIISFQNKRLRSLIIHAYKNVPYYRKLFDREGLKPRDIQTIDDLSKIPITSKNDLQLLPVEEVVARGVNPNNLIVRRTGGSSGEPSIIRRTWFEERLLGSLRLRAMHDLGLRMTDMTASILLIRATHPHDNQIPMRILRALGLYRRVQISCLLPPEDILVQLQHVRPDVLGAFSGQLSWLVQNIDNDRLAARPRFIFVAGEVLTPLMRDQIIKAFKAPVYELYASHEFNLIAWQCKETGELHTCDDGMIVEVLKDGRLASTAERGEVVGTNLHSFAMPFIRYRLGDIVTKGLDACPCGQPFSTIKAVQGRMLDYFRLPGGRMIHPYEIIRIIVSDKAPWIRQYQLIQEREDRIISLVVPSKKPTTQEISLLEESVTKVLGPGVEFRIVIVPEIKFEPNGKFRVSRSMVKSDYDGIDWER